MSPQPSSGGKISLLVERELTLAVKTAGSLTEAVHKHGMYRNREATQFGCGVDVYFRFFFL